MPWGYFCRLVWLSLGAVLLLVPPGAFFQNGGTNEPRFIYWNKTNPMFAISNNDHVIDVNNNDMLEIVCPKYDRNNTPEYLREYYIVYMVKKSEYNACTIYNRTEALMIVNCSEPTQTRIFTLYIQLFGGIPNMPDFEQGHTYYFISTSTGRKGGLANQVEGACKRGMKMMLRVCCGSDQTTRSPIGITQSPAVRTRPPTTRRTTPRPTTTTRPPTPPPTTTKKTPETDYKTSKNFADGKYDQKLDSKTIRDMEGENSAMINSKTSCSPSNVTLLTFLVLFCLFR